MPATAKEIITALEKAQPEPGTAPDMRPVARVLEDADIDAPCTETGITPLLWAIDTDNSLFFFFLLARSASATARGTGEWDIAPVDHALAKGNLRHAEALADRGAPLPPEVAAERERRRELARRYTAEIAATEKRLAKLLKEDWYTGELARLAEVFGVEAGKVRGRKGSLSFRKVPVRALAKKAGLEVEDWFAPIHAEALENGVILYLRALPGLVARDDVIAVPSTAKRDAIAVSSLLTGAELGVFPERMEKADFLDELDNDHPFHLLACGPDGVAGRMHDVPGEPEPLAKRLLEACGELDGLYETQFSVDEAAGRIDFEDPTPQIAIDLAETRMLILPWKE